MRYEIKGKVNYGSFVTTFTEEVEATDDYDAKVQVKEIIRKTRKEVLKRSKNGISEIQTPSISGILRQVWFVVPEKQEDKEDKEDKFAADYTIRKERIVDSFRVVNC